MRYFESSSRIEKRKLLLDTIRFFLTAGANSLRYIHNDLVGLRRPHLNTTVEIADLDLGPCFYIGLFDVLFIAVVVPCNVPEIDVTDLEDIAEFRG
jgi:hypothetical protein